jgi:16S rRNA (guanine966-N2)-methyltransferase
MRVIGGEFRSRVLKSLPGLDVRPTPDRLREALFNILSNGPAARIRGAVFVDVYAGTGAVGIEALSRGAPRAIFIEQNRAAVNLIRENLKSLGLEGRAQVREGRASAVLAKSAGIAGGILFIDPPYHLEQEYERSLTLVGGLEPELAPGLVIVQHSKRLQLAESYGGLRRNRELKQGDNSLSFYASEPGREL